MARYLEYEESTGHILCELTSETKPTVQDGHGVLEIDEGREVDIHNYAVHEGVLVRARETNAERAERLRLKKERAEKGRRRVKGLMNEFVLALLDEDVKRQKVLKNEYKNLKAVI